MASSVLSMRGQATVVQPLVDNETGSSLCWNGEAWKLGDEQIVESDTEKVFDSLFKASLVSHGSDKLIMEAFSQIRGPFACLFFDGTHQQLYFGRDCLGRRSLVKTLQSNGDLLIASVADLDVCQTWTEVEADGLYTVPLADSRMQADTFTIEHRPLLLADHIGASCSSLRAPYSSLCIELPDVVPRRLTTQSDAVAKLHDLLTQAIRSRVCRGPSSSGRPVAVLFSGGLDCTMITYYCHQLLPLDVPIDLLNVAFQNPRIHDENMANPYSTCPDRKTGLSALQALQDQCPGRTFRFVEINVPYTETLAHRDTIVRLMYPHDTEMDLSIASALYFAARGQGITRAVDSVADYTTTARVLFSGLGADELFAGYSRHAMAYKRGGLATLASELTLDFTRLGKRNLGRDDRVTSHWGREVRYPFLDEDLVKWAVECPIWLKCGFGTTAEASDHREPEIEDGKLVLRLLAWKSGLPGVAQEKKRAIQFGARTAKMHARKTKGTDSIRVGAN